MTERSINNLIIPSYAKKILDIGEDKDDEKEKIVALPTATSVTSTKSSYLNPNRLNILLKKPKYKMKTKEELVIILLIYFSTFLILIIYIF